MRLGSVEQSNAGRVRLGGAATFGIGKLEIGPGATVAFQSLDYQDRDGQSSQTLVSLMGIALARYPIHESWVVSGELGAGILDIDTLEPGNVFVEGGQRLKEPSVMPQFRAAVSFDWVVSRRQGLHLSVSPGFSYAIADKRFVSEVSSITTIHLMIGFRKSFIRTSAQ